MRAPGRGLGCGRPALTHEVSRQCWGGHRGATWDQLRVRGRQRGRGRARCEPGPPSAHHAKLLSAIDLCPVQAANSANSGAKAQVVASLRAPEAAPPGGSALTWPRTAGPLPPLRPRLRVPGAGCASLLPLGLVTASSEQRAPKDVDPPFSGTALMSLAVPAICGGTTPGKPPEGSSVCLRFFLPS